MSYNKDSLEKLQKKDLIEIILKNNGIEAKYDNLIKELNALNKRFEVIESSLKIAENVNTLLKNRIKDTETELYSQQQYSRRECLEISGIPVRKNREGNPVDDDLEEKVVKVLENIDVKLQPDEDIQACHRIKNEHVIIKLTNQKSV